MIRDSRTERYLQVGDKLLRKGKLKTAAAVYTRYADRCMADSHMDRARACLDEDPVEALQHLAKVERLVGPSGEGRRLSARAYKELGHEEIADRFLEADVE